MGGLQWRCVRYGLAAALWTILLGTLAGSIRLLPWLFAPEVPLPVTLPFARALLAAACEVSSTVGIPLGFALAAVLTVRRGELRAFEALGVSPAQLAFSAAGAACALPLAMVLLGANVDPGAGVPGRFATQLIGSGEQVCRDQKSPRTSWIPMVDVTWLCFPNRAPRVVAALPSSGGRAWFTARALRFSDDLSAVALSDFMLATRPDAAGRRLEARVERARITNLNSWGQPLVSDSWLRSASLVIATATLALGLLWLVFRRKTAAGLATAVVALATGFSLFHSMQRLDRAALPAWTYLGLPLLVVTMIVCAEGAWLVVDRRRRPGKLRR